MHHFLSTFPLSQGLLVAGSSHSRLAWLFPGLLLPVHTWTPGLLLLFCLTLFWKKKNHICLTCSSWSSGVQIKVVIRVLTEDGENILGTFPGVLWGQLCVLTDTSVVLGLRSAPQALCRGRGTSRGCHGRPLGSCSHPPALRLHGSLFTQSSSAWASSWSPGPQLGGFWLCSPCGPPLEPHSHPAPSPSPPQPPQPCPLLSFQWMKDMWRSDPCYADYGVDGTPCSFFIYLSEVSLSEDAHICPEAPLDLSLEVGRAEKDKKAR